MHWPGVYQLLRTNDSTTESPPRSHSAPPAAQSSTRPSTAWPPSRSAAISATLPAASSPLSTTRTPAPALHPVLPEPPQNDSCCQRQSRLHRNARSSIPDRCFTAVVSVLLAASGLTEDLSADGQKWTSFASPWHTLFTFWICQTRLSWRELRTLSDGDESGPFGPLPPNHQSQQLKSCSATGTKAPGR